MANDLPSSEQKLTLGKLVLDTARGSVKERVLTSDEIRELQEQWARAAESSRDGDWREYYP